MSGLSNGTRQPKHSKYLLKHEGKAILFIISRISVQATTMKKKKKKTRKLLRELGTNKLAWWKNSSFQHNPIIYHISSADKLLFSMGPCSSPYSVKKLFPTAVHLEEQWTCQACICHRAGSPLQGAALRTAAVSPRGIWCLLSSRQNIRQKIMSKSTLLQTGFQQSPKSSCLKRIWGR